MQSLEERLKEHARRLGFDKAGIAAATPPETYGVFRDWLADGYAGEMRYLRRHAEARRHPGSILPTVRSVVVVAKNYKPADDDPPPTGLTGRVARYARGVDYHQWIWRQLDPLLEWIQAELPGTTGRGVADTAPLLERDFARRAGLGWFGKNTLLLDETLGSYFLLGALLLDCELLPDPPYLAEHCGTCTACLDACPTAAFPAAGRLDARRCISYLTIELRSPVPEELRPGMGDWLFGCDACQEVCPWNRRAPAGEPAFQQAIPGGRLDLVELLDMSPEEYRRRFKQTALWRPRWAAMRRNAAIALGNLGDPAARPALERAAADRDPVVAEAARWALNRFPSVSPPTIAAPRPPAAPRSACAGG
jgi:epoxyqueuosine reductase